MVVLASVLATVALAGCSSLPWGAHPRSSGSSTVASSGKPIRHKPPAAHAGGQQNYPLANDPPVPDPAGMSRSQVVALLGQPDARMPSGSGENWTYRAGTCIVRLDFFLDVTRNDYYALGRSVNGVKDDNDTQRCLRRIASRARPS